ncbi:Hypp8895 [Branchiostoma lanceolatum]|uniref:Hypp8895 protein n=1 Tax=Branchiostoma lanceolatum TaxID=7740 RepID=A0A8K0EGG2_BRALA|nr:Hypp8895 [Branchiostoma lanceolatum]
MGLCGSRLVPFLPTTVGARWANRRFKFENLVFEGGGAKSIAYIGVCKVLEDAGILPQIKRFAGTSAGAITAALLAIGLTPQEMLQELSAKNLLDVLLDARFKALHWIPFAKRLIQVIDVVYNKGACPGRKFMTWFGDILERHLKKRGLPLDKDVTFEQLYNILGVELCIVAYNVNYDVEYYFHVKTTPVATVREAVRMSMSTPVLFQPYELNSVFTYVDGGLSSNFPLYTFDGWYLSMDQTSTFHRCLPIMGETDPVMVSQLFYPEYRKQRFRPPEPGSDGFFKTLGVLNYSRINREPHQHLFEKRLQKLQEVNPDFQNQRPPTKKERKYFEGFREKKELTKRGKDSIQSQMQTIGKIIQLIFGGIADQTGRVRTTRVQGAGANITVEEARNRFNEAVNDSDLQRFGLRTKEEAFRRLLLTERGELTDTKILNIYHNYLPLQNAKMEILGERPVSSTKQYYGTLMDYFGSKNQLSREDVGRCIAVDVDYLSTMDFDMEAADMEFLMKQGVAAATSFLCEYVDREVHAAAAGRPSITLAEEQLYPAIP